MKLSQDPCSPAWLDVHHQRSVLDIQLDLPNFRGPSVRQHLYCVHASVSPHQQSRAQLSCFMQRRRHLADKHLCGKFHIAGILQCGCQGSG